MFIGIDLGTSAVKAVLVDGDQRVVATASRPLAVSRPRPGWSEQDPADWVKATLAVLDALAAEQPKAVAGVEGIGLSGQQHGAVLLDAADKVLRPAILWNDTRSAAQCATLIARMPSIEQVTGNRIAPGFTAPKLVWVEENEPALFAATSRVLLPKAYVRLVLTGEAIEEMSDASGTHWLDVGRRDWSDEAIAATHLTRAQMPALVEGSAPAGRLRPDLAARFGFARPPLFAGGAGDNAAGAVGLGAIRPGGAFFSLGTSGVLWATTPSFMPNPARSAHAMCHAVPGVWHQMGVMLSAASCLAWWADVAGTGEADLLAPLGERPAAPSPALFLPYLSGERTPHADAAVRGLFAGLAHETGREALTQAVLEGVAFGFADCLDVLREAGASIEAADVIGGGSRSSLWIAILANVLDLPLNRLAAGETGGAFGAARLARLAVTGEAPEAVCAPPARAATILPDPALRDAYAAQRARWQRLYPAIAGRL